MKAIGPLVGFVMRETKGRADGGEVTRMIRERVGAANVSQPRRVRAKNQLRQAAGALGQAMIATRLTSRWRAARGDGRRGPAPSSIPPPAARSTTSSPVNGSVLAEVAEGLVVVVWLASLLATEQSCGLYDWHVELDASAELGSSSASPMMMVAMRFISPS